VKFDKDTFVFIAVCVAILILGKPVAQSFGLLPKAVEHDKSIAVWTAENPPAEPFRILKNRQMALTFEPEKGSIGRITFPEYLDSTRKNPIDLYQGLTGVGAFSVFDAVSPWKLQKIEKDKVDVEANTYTLTRRLRTAAGQEFLLTQVWTLESDYRISCRMTFRNTGKVPLVFPQLVVNGGNIASWAMYSGDEVRIPSHRMDLLTTAGKYIDEKAGEPKNNGSDFFLVPPPQVDWAGVSNKYFSALLTAKEPFPLYQNRFLYYGPKEKNVIIDIGAQYPNVLLDPQGEKTFEFRAYYGPKIISLLNGFIPGTARVMHLAWGPLDYLARLLLWVLVALHGLTGSYGISIILLTLIVRGLFYPATAQANASMRKMQKIQPMMKEIREKYKDDKQMQMQKMQELQREHGVNPLGGCLPVLLQIPVFFALYATLGSAVELRQVSFLWAKDLAAADTVCTIPLYFFNLPINPLALVMTGLMIVQQHMTPMSVEPMHRKMMLAMPIIMLLFLYDLPSGLTLYWSVSNFFSIIQMRLQQRHYNDRGAKPVEASGK